MQPLPLSTRDEWRAVTGVLTDIDDTLTDGGRLAPAAEAALARLAEASLPVIAITGRPAGWSEPGARAWPVRGIVAENGGVMLYRTSTRHPASTGMSLAEGARGDVESDVSRLAALRGPPSAEERLADDLQVAYSQDAASRARNFARLQACAADILARVPGATLARDSAGRLTDIAIDHSEFAHLDGDAIEAVCAVMREHGLRATVSSIHINGWIGDHDKWTAAAWAVPHLLGRPFVPAEWVYVGDSTNDQLMFERLPLTVGVANIQRFLPVMAHWPRYVTAAERGEGFAELVDVILRART